MGKEKLETLETLEGLYRKAMKKEDYAKAKKELIKAFRHIKAFQFCGVSELLKKFLVGNLPEVFNPVSEHCVEIYIKRRTNMESDIKELVELLKEVVEELLPDAGKSDAGNGSAGTRVTKGMQNVKVLAQEIRMKVFEVKKGR